MHCACQLLYSGQLSNLSTEHKCQAPWSLACLTEEPEVPGLIVGLTTYFYFSFNWRRIIKLVNNYCQMEDSVKLLKFTTQMEYSVDLYGEQASNVQCNLSKRVENKSV